MGRLKPGVTLQQASGSVNVTLQQMLQSEASQLPVDQRAGYLNQRIAVVDGSRGASTLRNSFEKPLLILMGLTALVLLMLAPTLQMNNEDRAVWNHPDGCSHVQCGIGCLDRGGLACVLHPGAARNQGRPAGSAALRKNGFLIFDLGFLI